MEDELENVPTVMTSCHVGTAGKRTRGMLKGVGEEQYKGAKGPGTKMGKDNNRTRRTTKVMRIRKAEGVFELPGGIQCLRTSLL
jgi:hypothetical protein